MSKREGDADKERDGALAGLGCFVVADACLAVFAAGAVSMLSRDTFADRINLLTAVALLLTSGVAVLMSFNKEVSLEFRILTALVPIGIVALYFLYSLALPPPP